MKNATGLIEAATQERQIGRAGSADRGPSMIVLGGIHGNEPAGVKAARRVLSLLERERPELAGEVVFLAGNLTALRAGVRFIHTDLNRHWKPETITRLREQAAKGESVEDRELRELLGALAGVADGASGELFFLDLHTSSADGPPFVTVGDTLRNRRFARSVPLPLILGLEEQVDGALLEHLNNCGCVTMGVEGGQHEAETSVDHLEAAIWLTMVSTGILDAGSRPGLELHRERLSRASREYPRVVEVRHRHPVRPSDRFRMEPGFGNFHPIERGRLLAHAAGTPVRAPQSGLLLLPLYQGQGNDGFFVSREVRPYWLWISAVLRRLRVGRLFPLLPGVRRYAGDGRALIVDTEIARWYPLEVFHLFGFRKLRHVGNDLVVSRRCYDLAPPQKISLS
jgi:succinylglutamate desuccinylase